MKDDDYTELSNALVQLREEIDKKIDRLAQSLHDSNMRMSHAKVNHQKILEDLRILVKEIHEAVDHTSGAFQFGRHVKVPDREETFNRIEKQYLSFYKLKKKKQYFKTSLIILDSKVV